MYAPHPLKEACGAISQYWYVHCRFFQHNSEPSQAHLLESIASLYVELVSLESMRDHKDFFFRYAPYALGHAVHMAFHFLCPGTRHLYGTAFRRILFCGGV